MKVRGRENIPQEGPVIIMSNHISLLDPPLLGAFLPRKIHYMAKKELFDNKLAGWLLGSLGAFPVKRGTGDRKALRNALKILKNEGVLGVFPEGTRYPEGELGEAHTGSIMIALMGQAPIVPAGIKNVKTGGRTTINFGKPIYLNDFYEEKPDKETQKEIAEQVMAEIEELLQMD
ncbi:lysophospholipid acyltransferase family protein [Halarsenatibacter silvermanii]|uniref:lysophospholipid acyltransferase family protein n=1 Tax=Halarsenatibacter silvermanii TaxID=321763 RepID=UPI0031F39D2F